jgi:hypothetical protein
MTKKEKEEFHNLKIEIEKWSGFNLEGSNQKELKDNLKSIHWSLECELDEQRNVFYKKIESLNIPEE